ncbi:hypothetical protein FA95DRAFT_1044905 [Auriscalpium vulgare]|uniref:Uncharacterized protein n=1 Tax=Auriscalpium vulgare TaxID=40419 RepID=A0ACB8S9Q3_9AGAM|nr:hypothetical protein FA95DRAFT_1044905 [Auriscalpium vulgare]
MYGGSGPLFSSRLTPRTFYNALVSLGHSGGLCFVSPLRLPVNAASCTVFVSTPYEVLRNRPPPLLPVCRPGFYSSPGLCTGRRATDGYDSRRWNFLADFLFRAPGDLRREETVPQINIHGFVCLDRMCRTKVQDKSAGGHQKESMNIKRAT